MSTARAVPRGSLARTETANDRFKSSFGSWLSASMIAATALHFCLFAYAPDMTAEDVGFTMDELTAVDVPPDIPIPPEPQALQRPLAPVVSEAIIDQQVTIDRTTWDEYPVDRLPPPPPEDAAEATGEPGRTFTPYTVRPDILNREEVARALERAYPPLLRDAGIGGTVGVWFYIDEEGRVLETRIQESSGHPSLDAAALEVADRMRFSPALNRDRRVAVWISLPISFRVR